MKLWPLSGWWGWVTSKVPSARSAYAVVDGLVQFVCGALGTNGEGRMPVEVHSVRGRFAKAGAGRIRSALSRRTQPPRQGQRSVIPMWRGADDEARAIDPLSRTPRRSSQVLPPKGRMGFLAIRELAKRMCRKSWDDEIFGQAARLAFYYFLSMFPVLFVVPCLTR